MVEDDKDAALGRNRTLDVHPAESAAAGVATAAVVSNQGTYHSIHSVTRKIKST